MEDHKFIEKRPTGNFRTYTPNASLVPERLEQEFYCVDEFGRGRLWLEPEPPYRSPKTTRDSQS